MRPRELAIVSGAGISEVPLDQDLKVEALVRPTREQQPSIGGDRSAGELRAKSGIEREANRAAFRVTPLGGALRTILRR